MRSFAYSTSKTSIASSVEPTFALLSIKASDSGQTVIYNRNEDLLMFYSGDRLCCHTRGNVLCCYFQTSPHGCKAWTNAQNKKHVWHIFVLHLENIKCRRTLPCTPLAATTMAPSMLERPSLSFLIDSGISLPPCFFTCGANSRPTQPATAHAPSTAVTQHY